MTMKMPWGYSKGGTSQTGVPNRPCGVGRAFGANLARFVEAEREKDATLPEPCCDCAFRAGTSPNGCLSTLGDAFKCVLEGEPFFCHVDEGKPCAGWLALRRAKD